MKIIATVSIEEVQQHERSCDASVPVGSHRMDVHCPLDEIQAFKVTLIAADIDRLFFLDCGFVESTRGESGKVADVEREKLSEESTGRVNCFLEPYSTSGKRAFDLRSSPEMALVLVCTDATSGPWTIIDGNHRAIAHYLVHGNMDDVPAYLCVHSRINEWRYVPHTARAYRMR